MRIKIDDNLFLKIKDTSFGTLSDKVQFVRQLHSLKVETQENFDKLTPREIEVLTLLAEGNNNPEVAALLDISRRTVENHRKKINRKLGIIHKRDLIIYALAFDLIPESK